MNDSNTDVLSHPHYRHRQRPAGEITKGMLKPSEQRLIEMVRSVGYGWITEISVHNGELVLEPTPRMRRKHRLGQADCGRCARRVGQDFKLKVQHRDLIARLRAIREGVIVSLEVQDGLPVGLVVEENVGI